MKKFLLILPAMLFSLTSLAKNVEGVVVVGERGCKKMITLLFIQPWDMYMHNNIVAHLIKMMKWLAT